MNQFWDRVGGSTPALGSADDPSAGREQTRVYYRLAAVLFIGGGIAAVPPDLLHVPAYAPTIYLLPLLAVVTGIACWLVADRAPAWGLHVVALIATLEVALTVAFESDLFAVYYALVAIFVAYIFADRRTIAAHLGLVILATLAPVAYDPANSRQLLIQALILAPTLIIAGGMVTYLRERLATSEERYRRLSECDPLTGIGNYRMLVNRLPRELRRHARYGRPLALIVIDLDDFKRVNDALGHQRGDLLLREVAEGLSEAVRVHDVLVRQGGDEFAVIAPETDPDEARALAERLGSRIGSIEADGYRVGGTMGFASYPGDANSLEDLLKVADQRLRVAKGESVPRRSAESAASDSA